MISGMYLGELVRLLLLKLQAEGAIALAHATGRGGVSPKAVANPLAKVEVFSSKMVSAFRACP